MATSIARALILFAAFGLIIGCSSSPDEQSEERPDEQPSVDGASQAYESAAAAQAEQEPTPVSDDELQQLAAVIDALMEREAQLRDEERSYEQRLARAESPGEVQQIQHDYMTEMRDAALGEGMSLEDFTALGQRVQEDPELQQRLAEYLDDEQMREFFGFDEEG